MTESLSLEETKALARKLASTAKRGDCYCLVGDLGAGKTEFARSFIRGICGEVTVPSPTFNILQIYDAETPVYHFDLYRLKDAAELSEVGLEDALARGITLIEWPELAADLLPENKVQIHIEILGSDKRRITIT